MCALDLGKRPAALTSTGTEAGAEFDAWVKDALPTLVRVAVVIAPGCDRDAVVQEGLLRAWLKQHLYDPRRGSARSWLIAIVADQARQAARAHHRRRENLVAHVPETAAFDVQTDLELHSALLTLTDRQRLAIVCHYFIGLTVEETAVVMHCSAGNVKSVLFAARRRLRNSLEGTM